MWPHPAPWSTQLDIVCERTHAGFWAEPVNALTNFAFLIAAWHAWRHWRAAGGADWPAAVLIALLAAIGIGSFLFHTTATVWALAADLLPIQLFILAYFFIALRRFFAVRMSLAVLATAVFVVASHAAGEFIGVNLRIGYGDYMLPIATVLVIAAIVLRRARTGDGSNAGDRQVGRLLLAGGLLAAVATALALPDHDVCARLPIGTHGVWHMLNALALNRLTMAAIAARRPAHMAKAAV